MFWNDHIFLSALLGLVTECAHFIINSDNYWWYLLIGFFYLQLAYCIVQFLEKDPTLTEAVRLIMIVDVFDIAKLNFPYILLNELSLS